MSEPWWRAQEAEFTALVLAAELQGYITHEQLAALLPDLNVDADMVEDLLEVLPERGIRVVDENPSA